MTASALRIHSENSAQGTTTNANPLVETVLTKITSEKTYGLDSKGKNLKLVDLGCGKLRHLCICSKFANQIILVDTVEQITRTQKFAGTNYTMEQFVQSLGNHRSKITIIATTEFEKQHHNADIVLSVAVMDVVLKGDREQMSRSAFNNLSKGRYFVVIVPRNDSSILKRCSKSNEYQHGNVFNSRGDSNRTFYSNFADHTPLLRLFERIGFRLVDDLSVYRQVCLILRTPS